MNKRAKVRENYFCRFADRIAVPEETLTGVENLYNVGSYLDAYRLALSIGPLHRWRGTPARVLGSRLAARLGGHKLSSILTATAWRETPRAAPAVLYRVYHLFLTKGPLSVWEFTEDWKSLDGLTEIVTADFLALRARVAGIYRDFELAWRLMDEALERAPDSPWLWCERAALLATEERLEEARLSCDKSLQIRPWFHPTVQVQAHLLQRERRMSDADAWLEDASKHLQSAEVIGNG